MEALHLTLETQINQLKKIQQQLLNEQLSQKSLLAQNKITDSAEFGQRLNQKRKSLGIDLETLSLQTELSVSTLKRIFKNPAQVKFSSVLLVAEALGVALCTL
ncbi:transcriptional regulator [Gallibacterium salpingitidis]|uniref:Transcriptional regulator n=1 Tax=Gallibacterium salpingitidis TaxID=505341 RepID=A0A1A7NYT4_9PAST|nr:helix-turn-helix transcriptional regulator [Gallibacterium salpingitidis]OBW94159.1 transcriptional regulator [Gallibacterium salpingitidis]OBX09156.1 transcriptional regulator [Gallibacterium salpingitidis]OBX10969.1 transcriptional regulator [Gallibacterium salpingitidis]WKS99652.1 helix-turn-helix transcriptional regulator [Gallibacterium salpingitidis]